MLNNHGVYCAMSWDAQVFGCFFFSFVLSLGDAHAEAFHASFQTRVPGAGCALLHGLSP